MNGVINNMQTVGSEYSDYLKSLRKDVSEQEAKTQNSPKAKDRVEVNTGKTAAAPLDIFDKNYADSVVSMLLGKIMQEPGLALEAQGGLQPSRMSALLES
ncbi:MAG: hypothetical protein FWE23_05620 [Chitinivibrionia bacterium]|nr:hypothetical protein [Chitinivibrionia bacterium]